MTMEKINGPVDLQLSLNPSLFKTCHRTEREEHSSLELSLSPPSLKEQEVNNLGSSERSTVGSVSVSNCSTATLGLSTLDLTMSIRALE